MDRQKAWEQGVSEFEAGSYWESHESWEPLWIQSKGTQRHFFSGMILLAAALHKTRGMGSQRGGRRNYAKALKHLALVPNRYFGIDVRELEARVHMALRDTSAIPRIPRLAPGPDS